MPDLPAFAFLSALTATSFLIAFSSSSLSLPLSESESLSELESSLDESESDDESALTVAVIPASQRDKRVSLTQATSRDEQIARRLLESMCD